MILLYEDKYIRWLRKLAWFGCVEDVSSVGCLMPASDLSAHSCWLGRYIVRFLFSWKYPSSILKLYDSKIENQGFCIFFAYYFPYIRINLLLYRKGYQTTAPFAPMFGPVNCPWYKLISRTFTYNIISFTCSISPFYPCFWWRCL